MGHLLALELLSAGERVLDVQSELGARARLLDAGDTDDARSVADAALRSPGVQEAVLDDHAAVLKVWSKRYRDLGLTRMQVVCRPHAVLCDLVPGGVAKVIRAPAVARLLDSVTPAGAVGLARWELAAAFLKDLRRIDAQLRETRAKLAAAVRAAGTTLTGLSGVGPVIAAAVIGDARDVSRFPNRDHFAACNGTALIEVSSGQRKGVPAEQAREPAAEPRGRPEPDGVHRPLGHRNPERLRLQRRHARPQLVNEPQAWLGRASKQTLTEQTVAARAPVVHSYLGTSWRQRLENHMTKKLNRAGIAAIVLAGTALAGTSLPAQAEPALSHGTEYLYNYYSNPQRTILVGVRSEGFGTGCVNSFWGQTTDYVYITSYPCSQNGPDHISR